MAKPVWIIDSMNTVELAFHAFGKSKVLLNGHEVASEKIRGKTTIPFSLNGGRTAKLIVTGQGLLGLQMELWAGDQLILSEREKKEMACLKCGAAVSPNDKFCQKCGAAVSGPAVQQKIVRLKAARKSIRFIAIMFFIFGVVVFLVKTNTNAAALQNLAAYQDSDIFPKLIAGKQVTVGYLREQLRQEAPTLLVTNFLLGGLMLGLFFYAQKSPLVAFLIAMGVYAAVIVLNAIMDPLTLGQGLALKIFVFAILINGVRMALELRKIEA
jgi:ribosomal protein L40E